MPSPAVTGLLDRLPHAKPTHDGWIARCPAHEDHTPSLAIGEGNEGRALVKCFAGCSTESVVEAIGMTLADIMGPKDASSDRRLVAEYQYRDEQGVHLYSALRYDPKDFRQRLANGDWKLGDVRRVIYRLDKLAGCEAVFVCEGEKDVDALVKIGVPSTCNAGGAGKWRDDFARQLLLMGVKRVYVLPDNDDPGRTHAHDVARTCEAVGIVVRVVELPGIPVKGDVSDWLASGGTKSELLALSTAAPIWAEPTAALPDAPTSARRLRALTLDQLRSYQFPARPALLLRDGTAILRAGHLGEVYAERGIGKTWFMQTLALVAASHATAAGFHAASPCRVLYIDGEMAADDLQTRFAQLEHWMGITEGAPVTTIAADWQDEYLPRLDTAEGQELVEPFIDAADLVLIDNRSCLFDPEGEKDPTKWQPAQDWLLSLRRRGKAVLMAHHSNRQGGARGHSKPEDPLNLLIKLARPDDYSAEQGSRFVVTFEKTRGIHGTAVAPFTARLTPEGWQTEGVDPTSISARLCKFVALKDRAGERVKTATTAVQGAGVNKSRGLEAWAELLQAGTIRRHPDGGFHVS